MSTIQKQTVDSRASHEWSSRPDDQRYLSLAELYQAVKNRADNTRTAVVSTDALKVYGTDENQLILSTELGPKFFTNWSFGQLANVAGGPAGYLKKLSAPLAAACINEGLQNSPREKSQIAVNGNDSFRCITSESYGRIWDRQVVEAIMRVTDGTSWQIPAASYATTNPKRATTLYASDRDVFVFLVDPNHPIEIPGEPEPLFRGFYAWNSEVGSLTFGLATFLYERVCDNRNIWGVSHRSEIRIRHSSGAPERFLREGKRALLDYANESPQPLVDQIKRAQAITIGKDEPEVKDWLKKRGLTLSLADAAINQTKIDGKDVRNLWNITQGITAAARVIPHTDQRIAVERIAGKALSQATA